MPKPSRSLTLYRFLLTLYPAGFRENYAKAMERAYLDERAESKGWLLLWIRLLADLAVSVPVQIVREVAQDGRHALRLWAIRPWQTGFAIAALAIGIGANTGVFSVVNTLLLSSLPFHDPARLASFHPNEFIPPHDTAKQFKEWLAQSSYLANAALVEEKNVNLGTTSGAQRVHCARASWNFFATLGTPPLIGRAFLPGEDEPGANNVAVISYGLWQQLFAGDRQALGSAIRVDGEPLTIVGIAPPGFDYPNRTALWKPAVFSAGNNGWTTVARLKPGIEWAQANAAYAAEIDGLSANRTARTTPTRRLRSVRDSLNGPTSNASLILMAGVVLVLLIACTNVANLMMARTADRRPELAIRAALGASRARLTQQLLTESLLLAACATCAGLVIASWITTLAAKVQPTPLAALSYSILDLRVLLFASGASVVSGLLFGLLPSLFIGGLSGARSFSQARQSQVLRRALAAVQVALTIILLTASLSVGRAFVRLMGLERGYDASGLVTVNVSLEGTSQEVSKTQLAYFDESLSRLRALPGVRGASATEFLPLHATGFVGGPFGIDRHRASRNSTMVPVLSDYFATMGGQILQGREFSAAEVRSGAPVALVNERFAAGFGGAAQVLGRQLTIGRRSAWQIIGVAKGMEFETDPSLSGANQVFVPAESPGGFFSTIVVRVNGRAEDHLAIIGETIRAVDRQVPVFGVKTMEQRLADFHVRPRFYRTAVWLFAAFAAMLALIGLYAIVSYSVVQRTRELGMRLALGTTAPRLRTMLLRQGLLTVAAGAITGIAAARLTGAFLENLVAGSKAVDLATSTALALLLAIAAGISIWAATRRISRLDVMAILRSE